MKIIKILLVFLSLNSSLGVLAQDAFYANDTILEIRLYFQESNWDHILDSLYSKGDEERLLGSVAVDGIAYDSVGIRYKGFSSVSVDRDKNPFNIKLDYVIDGQDHEGFDKLKLSNVIQDPSFVREVLSYEIARKYMPASRANFAKVYINDVYWGVYTNVEAVNSDFLNDHYGSKNNSFFKCNPQSLDFDGENSNLGNSPGTDTTAYYPYYDLKSDYGWTDLYELVDLLNENPDDIEQLLNVDRTLWMHAFNYSLINFDSYIGYAQNYYLYQDDDDQFNPIIWDLNMSFGSYRLADASEHYDGFSIEQAKTMDPLLHYSSVSVYPRPLMRNLFENDTYRRMYLAHMRTIMEENFDSQEYYSRAQELQTLIDTCVAGDTNKFYTYQHFKDNLNSTVSDLVDYPGIKDLMDARATYLSAYPGFQNAPTISSIDYAPQNANAGDNIFITASVANTDSVILAYRYNDQGLYKKITMKDDGQNGDGVAGDFIYGAELTNVGHTIQYYIYAENNEAGRFSPERAAYEYHFIQTEANYTGIVINEYMPINTVTAADQSGEFDDWVELYNNSSVDINLAGLYLSDNRSNLSKWPFPDTVLKADEYLIVWADENGSEPGLHANFKLSSFGESVYLTYADSVVLDSSSYDQAYSDVAIGRYPNGTGSFMEVLPTFQAPNRLVGIEETEQKIELTIYPNPADEKLNIIINQSGDYQLELLDINGRIAQTQSSYFNQGVNAINVSSLVSGVYHLRLITGEQAIIKKLIIQ